MKIGLEKPAVKISKLAGGKNEKARRGLYMTTFALDLYLNGNQNNWICDMSIRDFLIETLLHIYNVQ